MEGRFNFFLKCNHLGLGERKQEFNGKGEENVGGEWGEHVVTCSLYKCMELIKRESPMSLSLFISQFHSVFLYITLYRDYAC